MPSPRHRLRLNVPHPTVGEAYRPFIRHGAALTIAGCRLHHPTNPLVGEIVIQRLEELCPGEHPLLLDAGGDGTQGVRHHRQAGSVHTNGVEGGASGDVQTLLDGVLHHQVHHQLGSDLPLVVDVQIDACRHRLHRLLQVGFVEGKQPLCRQLFLLPQVLQRPFEHLGDVDFHHVVHGEFLAGDAHPVASHRNAGVGVGVGIAVAHIAFGQRLIAAEAGPTVFILE